MDSTNLSIGGFDGLVNQRFIRINELEFAPAEAPKITYLLGFANGMANLKKLPPDIGDGVFEIQFSEDGSHFLHREGKGVKFEFNDIDSLITLIGETVKVQVNMNTANPPKVSSRLITEQGDVYDGR